MFLFSRAISDLIDTHGHWPFRLIRKTWSRVLRDASGSTAIEYALIAGGIALAIIGAVTLLGGEVVALFTSLADLF